MRATIPMRDTITKPAAAFLLGLVASACLLPAQASGDPWGLLAAVEVEEVIEGESYAALKTYPPALIAAQDSFEITGYVVPITAEPFISTFMLVEDPANCPFCGGSGYGPVLEVQLKRPIGTLREFTEITVEGRIELIEDPETFQSYRLVDAIPRD